MSQPPAGHHTETQTTQLTATISGAASTAVMDAYVTGGVDRAATAPAPAPPPPGLYHPPPLPPQPSATQREHNRQNSHQLAS